MAAAQALRDEDIEAVVNAGDTTEFLGVTPNPWRVMVVGDRWSEAIALLEEWELEEPPSGRKIFRTATLPDRRHRHLPDCHLKAGTLRRPSIIDVLSR